ncbi:MAG: GGDEF domain-containing phosphodiesterase [Agathobacter sp.]|uniref:GGDEF domain-containing phosphodiesterase n=1 Tax=Agathobacter sp. TaxID=2021311 RepID=UPI002E79F0FB|nr:GGDEF domain-containing phosphodiesterase [Agathobacter sp.]MEE1217053.1 GGDEF domain-containing phosphodiesterase [Agathobacter sp.]
MMAFDAYKILDEIETGSLIDLIAPCMDDYLYIIDLKNDTLRTSQSAAERFMLPDKFVNNAIAHLRRLVYEKDRKLFENHKRKIYDGNEKRYNLLCRLMNRKNLPVWINCRGDVINDEAGKPRYIIGCMNETGARQRADNISGLLGEKEMAAYLYSQPKEKLSGYFIQFGIDDFGTINNVQGQIYGNYILKRVAECIAECLSSGQRIYHLVADQYMLVDMFSKSQDDVVQLFNRIGEKIDEFIVDENYKSIFSVSAGVTDISTLAEGAEECRKKSDFSLKSAKKRGRGSIYFFEDEDYKASLRKNTILSALRSATVNDFEGFEVYYQPILDSNGDRIIGAEALLRFFMHSDDAVEMVSPVEFIPLLEESRLIIPVGEFVLDEAAKMCREMQQYIVDFRVNINVSYIQIMRVKMANKILSAIKANHLRPESICIEMTESGFMDMTPYFCRFRKRLEENKIQFIIDDFGTGYSNLRYISEMNPDYVKIDKDFTARAMSSVKDYELFRKIIEMVHSVNVKICIEGIEKEEWACAMKEIHVDYMQGYLYGRPCEKGVFLKEYNE